MTARERIATTARLDAERNARAIAESRLACLPAVAARLAVALTPAPDAPVSLPPAPLARPYVARAS